MLEVILFLHDRELVLYPIIVKAFLLMPWHRKHWVVLQEEYAQILNYDPYVF